MAIDVVCRGCNAKYRVKDELAGRTAECKHCGQKFRVPYRSAVVRLGDDEELAPPDAPQPKPAEAKASRNFVEYGLDPDDPTAPIGKPKKDRPRMQQGILPDLVADLWLPLGLMIVCYGITLYTLVNAILHSHGVVAGFILLAMAVAMFFALVIPMTMRMIEGASKTLDFEAPNAIWLHTASCIALPTMGATLGAVRGGSVTGAVAFGLIGFVVMIPLMALMFRIDILKGVQAAVLAAMFYLLSLATSGAVIAAVALWLMPMWKMTRPWDDAPPVEVAKTDTPANTPVVPKEAPPAAPVEVAAAVPTTAPSAQDVTAAPAPVVPTDPWEVPIDAWAGPGRWPAEAHHVLHVRPPVKLLEIAPHEPYAAIVDAEALKVFDLRNGQRIGTINERPKRPAAAISKDGQFIAFEVTMTTGAVPPSIEIWSVRDGRMILRVPANGQVRALAFDPSGRMYALNNEGGKRVVQGWDVRTRRQVSSTPLESDLNTFAISANARLLATVRAGHLHVYDLLEGKLAGHRPIEVGFRQVGPVAFSPDGKRLLAAVAPAGTGAPRVLVWELADGKMDASFQLASVGPGDLSNLELQWLPDGEGFLCNGQLIDRASGKTIIAPQPPVALGATGRARAALSYFRVLYEFVPTDQNERVIYRVVSFPRGEVVASMKRIRGEDWEPPAEVDAPAAAALAAAPGAPGTASTAEPTSQSAVAAATPSTRPINPAAMKEWVVSILAVTGPDGPSLERQIKAQQEKLRPLEDTYRQADARYDELAGAYTTVTDSYGRSKRQPRYNPRQIGDAKATALRAQEAVRDVKIEIAQLERQLGGLQTVRTITGTLVEPAGIPVTVFINNAAHAQLADPLPPGTKIKVTGGPLFKNGALEVKLRTIAVVE
jgi:hypothetical protein